MLQLWIFLSSLQIFTSLLALWPKLKINIYFLFFLGGIEGTGSWFTYHIPFLSLTYAVSYPQVLTPFQNNASPDLLITFVTKKKAKQQ